MHLPSAIALLAAVTTVYAQSTDPNAACAPQALGYAPPTPGNAAFFLANPAYPLIASTAITPSGYSRSFVALNGATTGAGYLGFTYQQTYNTTGCASLCKGISGCVAFNTYIERDPLLNPAPACSNPPSIAQYKCSFWSVPVTAATATNTGQFREQFQVVIAGSNGKFSISRI